MVPKAFLDKNGKNVGKANVGIVGTGPYTFVSWQQGQEATVKVNPGYWNKARTPKVQQIKFKIIKDESTVVEGMVGAQIDGAFNLSGKSLKALGAAPSMHIVSGPSYFVHFLGLNVTRPPFTTSGCGRRCRTRSTSRACLTPPGAVPARCASPPSRRQCGRSRRISSSRRTTHCRTSRSTSRRRSR